MAKMMDGVDELRMSEMDGKDNTQGNKLLDNAMITDVENNSATTMIHPVDNGHVAGCDGVVPESDSMSESEREKMGSTPENLKKIDDHYLANNNSSASLSSSTEITPDEAGTSYNIWIWFLHCLMYSH